MTTYNIVLDNVEGSEGGRETAAALVGLAPSKADSSVDNRGPVGVNYGSSLDKSKRGERHIVCWAFCKSIHNPLSPYQDFLCFQAQKTSET